MNQKLFKITSKNGSKIRSKNEASQKAQLIIQRDVQAAEPKPQGRDIGGGSCNSVTAGLQRLQDRKKSSPLYTP